jgi:hypothetical protein
LFFVGLSGFSLSFACNYHGIFVSWPRIRKMKRKEQLPPAEDVKKVERRLAKDDQKAKIEKKNNNK